MIDIKIKLFGALKSFWDGPELEIKLAAGAGIEELRSVISLRLEKKEAGGLLRDCAFADETKILGRDWHISQGCTIAVLPPVCGG